MQTKKLDLDTAKKTVLDAALREAADTMDADMRKIYDATREQAMAATDRVLLTEAQAGITKYALEHYGKSHGTDPDAVRMLAQLTMPRKAYQAWIAGKTA